MTERLRLPAEWEPHAACWLAFPYLQEEWPGHLREAQGCVAALSRTIAEAGNEPVQLLVKNDEVEQRARSLIGESRNVRYVTADYGDCWVRDTAPLLGHTASGALGGLCFGFNGWGGKYEIAFDDAVSKWLTNRLDAKRFESPLLLEGGALESDGQGTFLTTGSCTLNDNRNPGLTRAAFEEALSALVSMKRLVWLDRGLAHDHTDGHVDMIARFVAPDTVLCMKARRGAPNAEVLTSIERDLRASGLSVLDLPAPRAVAAPDGTPLPASYCNFYIANQAVIVPVYEVPEDQTALREIANAFPGREVIGLPATDLLWGGGAFHCVTQAQPTAS
ncbi:MAG: agmatine deiminase family protein [Deltaproteobacteria bacterium]|nr:agmatine deiminase family protein [Deltaproteobacteria bacterium]MBW2158861.1 agmatine deiminase family protein [Deltaproteobacteria bacterium]